MNDKEKSSVIRLAIIITVFLMSLLLNYLHSDSEYDVIIVDKRVEYADDGIEMHYITDRIEHDRSIDTRCSSRVYYSCEVGKKYHVLVQSNGVWKSWYEIDD